MELVIDANVIFAALIKESHTRDLLLSGHHAFFIPEFIYEEFNNHLDILAQKTKLSPNTIREILAELLVAANVTAIRSDNFRDQLQKAEMISPDWDDVPYFALALKRKCAIWSNDKKLKEQRVIKIFNTEEISKM